MKHCTLKRLLTVLLSALLFVPVVFGGCGNGGAEQNNNKPSGKQLKIAEDGATQYELVVPASPSNIERKAISEMNLFFKEATGAEFNVVYDNKAGEFDEDYEYIYLGKTTFATADRVGDVSEERLTSQGFVLKTIGKAVFIVGGGDFGTLFGVYEFLSRTIDWDCIAVDEIIFNRSGDVSMYECDDAEIPDIEYRVVGNYQAYNDDELANRFRFIRAASNGFIPVNGVIYHNCFAYLPPETYNNASNAANYHPKWFSKEGVTEYRTNSDPIQLCYTAHGDAAEYEIMQNTALETLVKAVKTSSNTDNVQFSMWDNTVWCECPACSASENTYGSDSAVVINFLNDLKAKLDVRLASEGIDRDINLCFFAYHKTIDAPVTENADGSFSLINGLKCADGVYVFYAPIYANYYTSLDDPYDNNGTYKDHELYSNAKYYKDILKWRTVSDKMYLWYYSTNYRQYLLPYCNFNAMSDNFRIAIENDVSYLFNEGTHYTPNPTGFSIVKDYLESKLMWDNTSDREALTEKFFDNYFGVAADSMLEYYNSLNDHAEKSLKYRTRTSQFDSSVYEASLTAANWPLAKVKEWQADIDAAYAAIENVKGDAELYQKLRKRVLIESMAVRYMYLSLYVTSDAPADATRLRTEFKNDAVSLGYQEEWQGQPISALWSQWGV